MSAREQSTREQVSQLKSDKEQLERELTDSLADQKKDFRRQLEQAEAKVSTYEESNKDVTRQL